MNDVAKIKRLVFVVILGVVFVEAFKLFVGEGSFNKYDDLPTVAKIISAIAVIFSALFVHELGHLSVGLVRGLTFQFFILAFVGIKRKSKNKLELFFNTDPFSFLGIVALSPRVFQDRTLRDLAFTSIAGPIFSFLFGLFGIFVMVSLADLSSYLEYTILGFILANFTVFGATVIPSKSGIFFSDRKRFQILMSQNDDSKRELALVRMSGIYANGDVEGLCCEDICLLKESKDEVYSIFGNLYAYFYYMNHNMISEAACEKSRLLKFNGNKVISIYIQSELQKIEGKV